MRVLFAGSPAIAVPSLLTLSELELEGKNLVLAGILTNPDSRRGRRGGEEPTDVSAAASRLDSIRKRRGLAPIPQLKPEKLDERARNESAALAAELLVSFAYGRFFGPRFLALFPLGGINTHPSLLPKYRGACPIQAAILSGDKETGICIQKLAREMDAGDILAVDRFELSGRETTSSLSESVGRRAATLLRELMCDFRSRAAAAMSQEGEAVYCSGIKKEDGLINWNKSAAEIDARIRAYTPWPLSFTRLGCETLFILEALPLESSGQTDAPAGTVLGTLQGGRMTAGLSFPGCSPKELAGREGVLIQTGDGILSVSRLQWQTKKALDWKSFCNGARDFIGARLG